MDPERSVKSDINYGNKVIGPWVFRICIQNKIDFSFVVLFAY